MAARLTRDEEMELRRRRFEQSPEGKIKALEDRLSKLEPDEHKQAQQREAIIAFAKTYVSDTVFSGVRIKDGEAAARQMERLQKAIQKHQKRADEQEDIRAALCGPYGRFFNEGTD